MTLRILLVDDQALMRTGFKMILESEPASTSSARPRTGVRGSTWPGA